MDSAVDIIPVTPIRKKLPVLTGRLLKLFRKRVTISIGVFLTSLLLSFLTGVLIVYIADSSGKLNHGSFEQYQQTIRVELPDIEEERYIE